MVLAVLLMMKNMICWRWLYDNHDDATDGHGYAAAADDDDAGIYVGQLALMLSCFWLCWWYKCDDAGDGYDAAVAEDAPDVDNMMTLLTGYDSVLFMFRELQRN